MALKLITAPSVDLVSLADIKAYCRVDVSDDDALLPFLVKSAASHLETNRGVMGLAFLQQTWELYLDAFPSDEMTIPLRPLISVDKIEYRSPSTGAYVEWLAANYTVDTVSFRGRVVPVDSWPTPKDVINTVKVTFKAGFGATAAEVPESIRHTVKMLAAHWYENREAVSATPMQSVPLAVETLISQWREVIV